MAKRTITLGKWNDKPIEWIVLKEEDFGTLVISKDLLFTCCFNRNRSDGNIWESSYLRTYCNDVFYKDAFSEVEKRKIVNVALFDPSVTKDNVFLLSAKEAGSLMTQSERAKDKFQWTRSPNPQDTQYACRIDGNGGFEYCGYRYVYESFYVRPSIYIKESAVKKTTIRTKPKIDTSTGRSEKS